MIPEDRLVKTRSVASYLLIENQTIGVALESWRPRFARATLIAYQIATPITR